MTTTEVEHTHIEDGDNLERLGAAQMAAACLVPVLTDFADRIGVRLVENDWEPTTDNKVVGE